MAAKDIDNETLKRLNQVIDNAWSHVTAGTPDDFYIQRVKKELREAITPTPEQPANSAPSTRKITD